MFYSYNGNVLCSLHQCSIHMVMPLYLYTKGALFICHNVLFILQYNKYHSTVPKSARRQREVTESFQGASAITARIWCAQ